MKKYSMTLLSLLCLSTAVLAAAQVITSQSSNAPAGPDPSPTPAPTSTPAVIYGSRPTFVPASGNYPDAGNMPISTPAVPKHPRGKKHHAKHGTSGSATIPSRPMTQTQ